MRIRTLREKLYILAGWILAIAAIAAIIFVINIEEEAPQPMVPSDKRLFLFNMFFDARIVVGDEIYFGSANFMIFTGPNHSDFDPFYDELIFVHSEEESEGFPDNVIVAWPLYPFTHTRLAGLNWAITRDLNEISGNPETRRNHKINLEDFGLSYPITIEDMVDNWEKVHAVWNALGSAEHRDIRLFGQRIGSLSEDSVNEGDDE